VGFDEEFTQKIMNEDDFSIELENRDSMEESQIENIVNHHNDKCLFCL